MFRLHSQLLNNVMYNPICMRAEVYGIIGGKIDFYCRFLKSIIFIAPVSDIYFLAGIHAIQRKVEKSESYCYISTAWMKKSFG